MFYPSCKIKSFIIEYISEKNFCIAKEIHNALYQCNKIRISLQGLYKNLRVLIKENIIVKHGQYYTFTKEYLEKMKVFVSNLRSNVFKLHDFSKIKEDIDQRGKVEMLFCDVLSTINQGLDIVKSILYKANNITNLYRYQSHCSGFFISKEEEFLEKISRDIHFYDYVYADTKIDYRACKISLDKYSSKKSIKVTKKQDNEEKIVLSDYIVTLHYDPRYFSKLSNFLKEVEGVPKDKILNYYKYEYIPNTLTVEKNSDKAKDLIDSFKGL